ncbi:MULTISPECIES: MATE family efflux transporter [Enterobacter cloacae complex]|uniref:Flippase n=5 Tax=Enterobacter cloacae complex TaxID=354276 RepID=A0A6B9XYB3_ENTCL|nr:hypothetical protein [Enterobacter hormaechei]ARZ80889.1 hypothetical protein AM409_22790 [Enterobacter cloacae complex sp.]KYJ77241.1 hypothetical protein AT292_20215 [Enterobacter cloacae]EKU5354054.1 hypothetical protein [Enterobacter hormaechei]ELH1422557.1 hypothetical protein [Enterobacter hormaechei]KAA0881133.1 hypothetical protein EYC94_14345 [Enterobacter hormaechei]
MKGLLGLGLRASTLGGKVLLMLYLTHAYGVSVVGAYGILVSIISFSVYLSGLELYSLLLKSYTGTQRGSCFAYTNQMFFSLFSSLIVSFSVVIYMHQYFPYKGVTIFAMLLTVTEVLLQEYHRILLAKGRATIANILLFVRNGVWCYFILIFLFYIKVSDEKIVSFISFCWLCANLIALCFVFLYAKYNLILSFTKISFKILYFLIRKSVPIFISSIFIRVIVSLDKVLLSHFTSLSIVGVYTFYTSIGNALQALLDAGMISYKYKDILFVSRQRKAVEFMVYIKKLYFTSLICMASIFLASLLFFTIFNYNDYYEYAFALLIVLISSSLQSLGALFKQYAIMNFRSSILKAGLLSFAVFLIACGTYKVLHLGPIYTIAISVLFASFSYILYLWKWLKKANE